MTEFSRLPPMISTTPIDLAVSTKSAPNTESARKVAEKLEATFLAEMLKSVGFGSQENSFSGGVGEDQFASFHRQAIAEKMAAAGGIGLAEHILRHMTETRDEA